MSTHSMHLHRAPWVVPVSGPVLRDGAVAISSGRIVAVDSASHLCRQFPSAELTSHPASILTPALINAHIHLELSHLTALSAAPLTTNFTGWIRQLLELREELGATGELVSLAACQVLAQQYQTGVSVLADIGNTGLAHALTDSFPGLLLPYREYLGLAERTLEKNLERLNREPATCLCTGHAPYSTHPVLLQRLKERAQTLGQVFPLHVAEPEAEGAMLSQGRGELVDFVRERGFWDNTFQAQGSGGSLHYLERLGLLDEQTLCVHAIHVHEEEVRIMAARGVKICLCPGSNRFLGTGKAPVQQYLDHGLLPALGTDSLASNPELSLWREMRLLSEDHPAIDAADIFAMATRGGAEALGLADEYGTLAPGKKADILAVPMNGLPDTAREVYTALVHGPQGRLPIRLDS